ncbi:MAG TPA: hypothetical protein VG247_04450 [Pseudonocardiaceae bacterium]|nr:hypothetical protein [Pseudonocardiaceae bacterium]
MLFAEMVPEAGGWSVFIPGLPVAADGRTLDVALAEMVDALNRQHRDLVELINMSDDAQLRELLLGE